MKAKIIPPVVFRKAALKRAIEAFERWQRANA